MIRQGESPGKGPEVEDWVEFKESKKELYQKNVQDLTEYKLRKSNEKSKKQLKIAAELKRTNYMSSKSLKTLSPTKIEAEELSPMEVHER